MRRLSPTPAACSLSTMSAAGLIEVGARVRERAVGHRAGLGEQVSQRDAADPAADAKQKLASAEGGLSGVRHDRSSEEFNT